MCYFSTYKIEIKKSSLKTYVTIEHSKVTLHIRETFHFIFIRAKVTHAVESRKCRRVSALCRKKVSGPLDFWGYPVN